MAHIKFEQTVRPEETKLQLELKALVKGTQVDDCRKLRPQVQELLNKYPGRSGYVMGGGGSHLWIHRKEEHVEGNWPSSERWAIITDQE